MDIGDFISDFALYNQNGNLITKEHLLGKTTVIYFYPKDDTPGCTTQACQFRDLNQELLRRGIFVLGVSKDSIESHAKFHNKYQLTFDLLSDTEHILAKQFDVIEKKLMFGVIRLGFQRSTFIIDPSGKLIWQQRKVKVKDHVEQVLKAIDSI